MRCPLTTAGGGPVPSAWDEGFAPPAPSSLARNGSSVRPPQALPQESADRLPARLDGGRRNAQQVTAAVELPLTVTIGPPTAAANPHEAFGEHVQQEAAQEFHRRERHPLARPARSIGFPCPSGEPHARASLAPPAVRANGHHPRRDTHRRRCGPSRSSSPARHAARDSTTTSGMAG